MVEFLQFLTVCIQAYRQAKKIGGIGYCAHTFEGVPQMTVLVGVGREAWRVSTLAIETYVTRKVQS